MAFNTNSSGKQIVEYSPNDTYKALVSALNKDFHFTVKDTNSISRTILVKAGISWKSWGENLFITVSPVTTGMAEISITSTSEYGWIDWGKNQENINNVLKILSYELTSYKKVNPGNTVSAEDIPAQIKKLSDLKDAGILTDEEFQKKKEQLLAKI
jgi:hypothetical protein